MLAAERWMKTALFFAVACCGAIACGGHDQRARAPSQTTLTSGEQTPSTPPSIEGYGPGESKTHVIEMNRGESIPVPDTSTEVPGDATADGGTR
jgi:hypothetical protein